MLLSVGCGRIPSEGGWECGVIMKFGLFSSKSFLRTDGYIGSFIVLSCKQKLELIPECGVRPLCPALCGLPIVTTWLTNKESLLLFTSFAITSLHQSEGNFVSLKKLLMRNTLSWLLISGGKLS